MEALGDKTVATLATSLDGVARQVAKTIAEGVGNDSETWLIHVLVGDAIHTNEAAARRLYAKAAVTPMAAALKYCLMVVKCASHQANLAAKGAAIGVAATVCNAATGADAEGAKADTAAIGAATTQPHLLSCGILTRLYKCLVADYFEEFSASLRFWATTELRILDESWHAPRCSELCARPPRFVW